MKKLMTTALALILMAGGQAAWALSEQVQTVQDATAVINDFVNIPENAIPPALLSEAYGIAIIPGVIKAGFIVGGRYGEGVLSVRTADGSWSHPVFINLAGASVGWQIGAASSDIILVFKTQRGVDQIVNGQVTLGGDISIAAGPIGRTASAATNVRMSSEIYSYSRARGLFAGIALEGGVITVDEEANWRYYGSMVDSRDILHRSDLDTLPKTGQRLIYTLNHYMPPINGSGGPIPYGDVGTPMPSNGSNQAQTHGQAQPSGNGQAQPYGNNRNPSAYGSGEAQPYGSQSMQQYGQPQAPVDDRSQPNSSINDSGSYNYGPVYETPQDEQAQRMGTTNTRPASAPGNGY